MQNIGSKVYLVVALFGIFDAIYTATEYAFRSYSPVCTINSYICCACVGNSGHTSLLGIPFYDFGLIWFPLIFILGVWFSDLGKNYMANGEILILILMIGNLFTIYLWYLEVEAIHAICPFCVSLYVVNYALTGIVAKTTF